jgi:hypothetical protein
MENPQRFATLFFQDTGNGTHTHRSHALGICAIALFAFCPATFVSAQNLPEAPQSRVSAQQDQDKAAKTNSNSSGQSGSESADKKQTSAAPQTGTPKSDNSDQSQAQQTKRMMWVVPNFGAVSANTQLPPLSTREKFKLAENDSFDYSAFIWTGILAFQSWGAEFRPRIGAGCRRLWPILLARLRRRSVGHLLYRGHHSRTYP